MLYILMLAHWIGDFLLQSNWMAMNKSKNNFALSTHVGTYTGALFIITLLGSLLMPASVPITNIVTFALINGFLHWLVDFCTSRGTSYFWSNNQRHWFFTLIGFDQLVHMSILIYTYQAMLQ